jgi:transcriptional regulator with XRE-family HTH domain
MPSPQRPTVRSRRIGSALRKLRDERGLTVRAICRQVPYSVGWLSNIENGNQPIHPDDLGRLLDFYGVSEVCRLRGSLMHLAKRSRSKNWQQTQEGRFSPAGDDLASLETDAATIRTFSPDLVPGLTQIESYIRAVVATGLPSPTRDPEELVAFRLSRQPVLLKHNPPIFCTIIGQAALLQRIGGPGVMQEQLLRLSVLARMPNIELRVLPLEAGAHLWVSQPFDLISLKPPGDLTVAVAYEVVRTVFIVDEDEVSIHEDVFNHLLSGTLNASHSLEVIEQIASEL